MFAVYQDGIGLYSINRDDVIQFFPPAQTRSLPRQQAMCDFDYSVDLVYLKSGRCQSVGRRSSKLSQLLQEPMLVGRNLADREQLPQEY